MSRKARELSAIEVKRLTAFGRYAVGGVDGLFPRESGSWSWVPRHPTGNKRVSVNGRPLTVYRDMRPDSCPNISLAIAREKARESRDKLAEGIAPITEKKAAS